MSVEIRDQNLVSIVDQSAEFEKLATGFLFTEGPLWNAKEKYLLFSDIPGNQITRWSADKGATPFRKPSNMSNGLTWDRQGRLLACEHATSHLTRTETDGRITVVASHYDGKELNSPNDVVVKTDGSIYFTDPSYGRNDYFGVKRESQLGFRGVYRVDPASGKVTMLANDFGQPNGLCLSVDESKLFVNDTDRAHIRVFDLKPDGTVANGKVWAEVTGTGDGAPDGMKIDSQGNLYCTGPGGIHVFDRSAKCLGVIRTPEPAANFTWGDADLRSLFVTATSSLYRVKVKVPGKA
jgi:gluconolactonase